jgi:hypothetical protein
VHDRQAVQRLVLASGARLVRCFRSGHGRIRCNRDERVQPIVVLGDAIEQAASQLL